MNTAQYRLAKYYLDRLLAADTAFRRGQASSADSARLLNQDWAQIAHWQAWAAANSAHQVAARLCAAYPQAGAEILITRQTPQERIAWLEAGLAAARATGDARAEAVCLFRMAWAIHKQATLERAEQVVREALAQAEAVGDALLTGQSLHLLGEITVRRGDFVQAELMHERSLDLLQSVDAQAALADVYFSLSENAYFRGEYARARDYTLHCYRIHTALGLNPAMNNNLNCLGIFTAEAGDLDAGETYLRQSIALCRQSGAQSTLAHGLKSLAGFMILRNAFAQARIYADESLQIAQAIGEDWLIPDILIFQGRIHMRTGDLVAAQRDTAMAVTIARETGYRLTLVEALINLADVQIAANQLEQAHAALREGLTGAIQTGTVIHILYGVFVAAKVWHTRGFARRAAEWVGLLQRCPGVEYAVRSELPGLCAQLRGQLGAQPYAAAIERGGALRLHEEVASLQAELAIASRFEL
ncbi:MAG: tetratricopeptide repeat protein [Roseiflexaceae bacterium]|nr:tetratricopeptide repeat protein [Roseiflexaceae bacterium]